MAKCGNSGKIMFNLSPNGYSQDRSTNLAFVNFYCVEDSIYVTYSNNLGFTPLRAPTNSPFKKCG